MGPLKAILTGNILLAALLSLPFQADAAHDDWVPNIMGGVNDGTFAPRVGERFNYFVNSYLDSVHLTEAEYFSPFSGRWVQDRRMHHIVIGNDAQLGPNSRYPRYYYYGNFRDSERWGYADGAGAAMQWFTEEDFINFTLQRFNDYLVLANQYWAWYRDYGNPTYYTSWQYYSSLAHQAHDAHELLELAWRDRYESRTIRVSPSIGSGPSHTEL